MGDMYILYQNTMALIAKYKERFADTDRARITFATRNSLERQIERSVKELERQGFTLREARTSPETGHVVVL